MPRTDRELYELMRNTPTASELAAQARITRPSVSLMSPRFQWVPSYSTDLRESFRRIKEAQEATQ
jgi:hypothetical protein